MRQFDPMSPLLFCMAEEVLGLCIQSCICNHQLTQAHAGANLFVPPFIFYVDDVIIYMSDNRKNVRTLVQIFNNYALISGQHINPSKSKVHFSKNISNQFKNYAIHLTGLSEGGVPFIFLGTPIFRGAPKTDYFRKLSDEIVCKMNKWKGSTLSLAGRVCMVKSVIIPSFIHVMRVYILPAAIITKPWQIPSK